MKHPEFTCSSCGSANLRRSHTTALLDFAKMALGIYPFRCLDCRERFWINIWLFSKGRYAMCPRCLAVDVGPSGLPRMRLSFTKRLLLAVGARGYRCSLCNHRFITFKRVERPPNVRDARQQTLPRGSEVASAVSAGK